MTTAPQLFSVCIFCGSAKGNLPAYCAAAERFGAIMAKEHIRLVYGGGNGGLMGAVARAVIQNGGYVTGFIPQFLEEREAKFQYGGEIEVVPDMHTRKRRMFEAADAFVVFPGGIGTLEEFFEQLTWEQLGLHEKPIVLANIGDFWRPLDELITHLRRSGFIRPQSLPNYHLIDKIEDILPKLRILQAKSRPYKTQARLPI